MVKGSNPVAVNIAPVSSKEFLDIQATIKCRFTLKSVRDMIITYIPLLTFHLNDNSRIFIFVLFKPNRLRRKYRLLVFFVSKSSFTH